MMEVVSEGKERSNRRLSKKEATAGQSSIPSELIRYDIANSFDASCVI